MRNVTRMLAALSAVVGFMIGATPASLASTVDVGHFTYYTTNSNCTHGRVIANHVGNEARTESRSWINAGGYGEPCAGTLVRAPGNIRAAFTVFKKTSTGSWSVCWATSYVYNSANAYGAAAYNGSRTDQCGSGTYRTQGLSGVNVNGTWYGAPNGAPVNADHVY